MPLPNFGIGGCLSSFFFFFSFNVVFFPSLVLPIYFLVLVRKFVLFSFVVFATLVDANPEKNKDYWRRGACFN